MVIDAGLPALGFFDFTAIGLCAVSACGLLLFFLSKTLPERREKNTEAADYFIEAEVLEGSSLIGKSIEANGLRNLSSLFLVEINRKQRLISPVSPQEIIEQSDQLIFSDVHL